MAQTLTPEQLELYRADVIASSLESEALMFGSFTLKSGRQSPYFVNSGKFSTGPVLARLATAYAALIVSEFPTFDVLFGPAYKGISLAAVTAVALSQQYNISVGFGYNRKEAKDHGEGGWTVGADVKGKKVLILDDVFTAGTAIRESAAGIKSAGGQIVGAVLCLDREEVGKEGEEESARTMLVRDLGAPVTAVLRMRDLIAWLEKKEDRKEDLAAMNEYRARYGVKEA